MTNGHSAADGQSLNTSTRWWNGKAAKSTEEKMKHKWKECKYKSTSRADAKISISFKLLDLDYTPGQGTARTRPAPKHTETHFD